jgi:(2Fe-2S) ferredoxin
MTNAIDQGIAKARIATATHHLFLCLGPDCCDPCAGEALWEYVKTSVKRSGVPVMRTKASCFRICAGGPWLVVYPDGAWYGAMTPERFERILRDHVQGGVPIAEWMTIRRELCGCRPDEDIRETDGHPIA